MRQHHTEAPDRGESNPQEAATDSGSRRKQRSDTRGSRTKQRHTGGESKERGSDSRGSDRDRERSHERHSHREGRSRDRGRAQRGDVRAAILVLLAEEPMHGYQLMQAIADRTRGAWRPSPGTIYPTIAQLEQEDLVSVVAGDGRKLATLTEAGRDYLTANETMTDPFTEMASRGGGAHDLRGSVDELQTAAKAVAKSGSDDQVTKAHQVLTQARRDLYLILAETPVEPAPEETSS